MSETPPRKEPDPQTRQLRDVVVTLRYLAGLLGLLILAVATFHPFIIRIFTELFGALPLFVLVLIFVYVVRPMVEFFHRLLMRIKGMERISQERTLALTYIFILACVVLVLGLVIPLLVNEARTLADKLPQYAETVRDQLRTYRSQYTDMVPPSVQAQISEASGEVGKFVSSLLQRGVQYVGAFSSALLFIVGAALLVPLLGFYFLKDGTGILEFMLRMVDVKARPQLRIILADLHRAMQNFIKGQVILCLVIGVVTTLAMLFVLPEYCIGLGLVAGITEAVPIVGPLLGAVPAVIIAFAAKGWGTALIVMLIYLAIQQLENIVLVPRVMGESLGLHPLSLLVGMMIFGNLLGFWGVLLSAPLVAAVKVLVVHLVLRYDSPNAPATSREPH